MRNKGIKFSQDVIEELNKVYEIIDNLFELSIKAFDHNTFKGIENYSIY